MGTKCPKCENTTFENSTEIVSNAKFKINFIRCSHCKTAIGVMDYANASFYIMELAKKLGFDLVE